MRLLRPKEALRSAGGDSGGGRPPRGGDGFGLEALLRLDDDAPAGPARVRPPGEDAARKRAVVDAFLAERHERSAAEPQPIPFRAPGPPRVFDPAPARRAAPRAFARLTATARGRRLALAALTLLGSLGATGGAAALVGVARSWLAASAAPAPEPGRGATDRRAAGRAEASPPEDAPAAGVVLPRFDPPTPPPALEDGAPAAASEDDDRASDDPVGGDPGSDARPRDLLAAANRARGAGAVGRAEALYLRVARRHPGTGVAQVALASAASIRLDVRKDARGAARLFQAALEASPRGALALEARVGLARAWRRAGLPDRERAALGELLAQHPRTPAAHRAERRLAELAGSASER